MSGVCQEFVRTHSFEEEGWRPWPTGPYEVSNLGRIRRTTATRTTPALHVLRSHADKTTGYLLIGLRDRGGVRKTRYVHIVVAEVFLGPRPDSLVVNHKDGDKANCALWNLEYITHAANVIDGIERAQRRDASVMTYSSSRTWPLSTACTGRRSARSCCDRRGGT